MRFEKRQFLEGTVDEVERAMLDPRYLDYLLQHHGVLLEVQALERKEEGARVRRRVRYRPRPVIPSVGPKEGAAGVVRLRRAVHLRPQRKEMTFTNAPTCQTISNMLVNTGMLRLRSVGARTERTLDGEIKLLLPFLLKPLAIIGERLIHSEGLKILDAEAPVLDRYIAELRAGRA